MDEGRLDRVRAEFRELLRQDQQAGWGSSQISYVHPESVEELYTFAREELAARHDVLAEEARRIFNLNREESTLYRQLAQIYLDELRRRETVCQGERMEALTRSMVSQGDRMERLTRSINLLTVIVVIATLVGVGLTAWSVLFSG